MKDSILITLFLGLLAVALLFFPQLYYREMDEEYAREYIQDTLETKYGEAFHVNRVSYSSDGEVEADVFPMKYGNPERKGNIAIPYFRGSANFNIYPFGRAGKVDDNWDKIQLRLEREELFREKISSLFEGNIIVRDNSRLREYDSNRYLFDIGKQDILEGLAQEKASEEFSHLETRLDMYIFQTLTDEKEMTEAQKNIFQFVEFLRNKDMFDFAELNIYFMDKRMLTPSYNRYIKYLKKSPLGIVEVEETSIYRHQQKSRLKISAVLQAELNKMTAAEIEQEIEQLRKTSLDHDDLRVNCQYEAKIIPLSWLESSSYIVHQDYYEEVEERDAFVEHIYDHWSNINIRDSYAYSFLEVEEPTMFGFFEGGSREDENELMRAIREEDEETVYEYVNSDMNLNFIDNDGYTPLMRAVDVENLEAVRQLVRSGRTYDLETPLKMVIENKPHLYSGIRDRMDYFQELLQGEPDLGDTILLRKARQSGNETMERELIKAGADVDVYLSGGRTPLMSAVRNDDHEEARLLVEAGADVNHQDNDGYTGLMYVVLNENLEMLSFLLDAGADVNIKNDDDKTALMLAAGSEELEKALQITEMLTAAGARVDVRDGEGRTALMFAAEEGNKEIVEMLIARGSYINNQCDRGNQVLEYADDSNNSELYDYLVEHGASETTAEEFTLAAGEGRLAEVKELLARGVNINLRVEKNYTPLMKAALKGQQEVVEFLVEAGADVNLSSDVGLTALMFAVEHCDVSTVELLIEAGADIKARDEYGFDALMVAAFKNKLENVRLLIEKGADVNTVSRNGYTPLILAAEQEHTEMIEFLIEAGADIRQLEDSRVDPDLYEEYKNDG